MQLSVNITSFFIIVGKIILLHNGIVMISVVC